jgi:hypothetical protein
VRSPRLPAKPISKLASKPTRAGSGFMRFLTNDHGACRLNNDEVSAVRPSSLMPSSAPWRTSQAGCPPDLYSESNAVRVVNAKPLRTEPARRHGYITLYDWSCVRAL